MADAVAVVGVGVVSPLGSTLDGLLDRLFAGEGAVKAHADLGDFPVALAARVPGDPDGHAMARDCARQALAQAGLAAVDGAYIGTTLGESAVFEALAPTVPGPDAASGTAWLDALGGGLLFPTACVAGSQAIGEAAARIASGQAQALLAGGVEPFSRIAQVGFGRLRAMAPAGCAPFAGGAGGMSLGAGAALLALESARSAQARGAKILAYVQGFGLSCDADHPTRPRGDGDGLVRAVRAALGGRRPDWICGHGSGTPGSDAAELQAYAALFGALPPLSGLKGALGHALGAASALQAAVIVGALGRRERPPTRSEGPVAPRGPLPSPATVLSAAMAFGGLNAALVLGDEPVALPELRPVDADPRWRAVDDPVEALRAEAGDAVGLAVAVREAGMAEATKLWTEALTHGPRFANPAVFPATLPSHPATALARALGLRGPNTTLHGDPDALVALARGQLGRGAAERVLLVDLTRQPARVGRLEVL